MATLWWTNKKSPIFLYFLFRHIGMNSQILHFKVNGSSIAVLKGCDCDQAMKDCEFSEKGKTDT